jgi:O-antigen/teichoic acid export membrane protein
MLRRSLVFSFIDRYSGLLTGVISSMILARLLSPDEVGVFSVVMVLLSLANTLRDMGAGQYLLQEKELTPQRIRAVWTVQLLIGLVIAALVAALAPAAAAFYVDPRLSGVMLLLALNYVVNPIGSVTYAWLMREMRFDAIAVIRFASAIASALVSIALAYAGHGPMSLAWGSLAGTVATAVVSAFFRPAHFPWRPGFAEVKRVLSFGTKLTGTGVLHTISNGFPEFIVGKLHGLAAAGYMSRASGLVGMFHRLISDSALSVALALFSRTARDAGDLKTPFLKGMSYITVLGWSFAAALASLAHPTIRVLYGDQWDSAVGLTRVLALSMVLAMPIKLCHSALLGAGQIGSMVRASIFTACSTLCLAGAAAPLGVLHLASGLAVASLANSGYWLWHARKVVGFAWPELLRVLVPSMLVACIAGALPFVVGLVLGFAPSNVALALGLGAPGAAIGFLLGCWLTKHPILVELRSLGSMLINKCREWLRK